MSPFEGVAQKLSRARRAPTRKNCPVGARLAHDSSLRTTQTGVTLIELVITIVIVSVAVAGVVGGFSLVMGRSADTLVQSRTTAIGQAYLDEILARNFDRDTPPGGVPAYEGDCRDNDPDSDANSSDRETFTGVEQFNGLSDQPPRRFEGGEEIEFGSAYSSYEVQVEVSCAGLDIGMANNEEAKRIDVRVRVPQGRDMVFTAYKGNY